VSVTENSEAVAATFTEVLVVIRSRESCSTPCIVNSQTIKEHTVMMVRLRGNVVNFEKRVYLASVS